jgi:hypothetical protein
MICPKEKGPPKIAGLENDPAIAVSNRSFEHVLQHAERAGLLSASSEGMSATTRIRLH